MKPTSVRRSRARAASVRADTSSPSKRTRPLVGRSRVPSRWSRVDLPTPEAPMMATLSPALTVRLTPRKTRTGSGPMRYSRSSSSATTSGSLIAEHFDRIHARGPAGRRQGREEGDDESRADNHHKIRAGQLHRQVADLVLIAGQPDDLVGVLHPDQQQPEGAARHGAPPPDQHPGPQEHGPDAPRPRPHRP